MHDSTLTEHVRSFSKSSSPSLLPPPPPPPPPACAISNCAFLPDLSVHNDLRDGQAERCVAVSHCVAALWRSHA